MADELVEERVAEAEELERLLARHAELLARVDAIEAEHRTAGLEAQEASERLVQIERDLAGGSSQVSPERRAEAEKTLLRARGRAGEPWGERRRAAMLAAEDARQKANLYAGAHIGVLLDEVEAEGRAAASRIDSLCEALVEAFAARMGVEQQVFGLLGRVRRADPSDVSRTRSEGVVNEARRLLELGGEVPPTVRERPGEHVTVETRVPAGAFEPEMSA